MHGAIWIWRWEIKCWWNTTAMFNMYIDINIRHSYTMYSVDAEAAINSTVATVRPWSHHMTRLDSTQLNWGTDWRRVLWSISWPAEMSWIGLADVIILKTQLNSTKKSPVCCQLWNSEHVQNLATDRKLAFFVQLFLEWPHSYHATRLDSPGQFSDHRTQFAVVTKMASSDEFG